ncbi:MAG: cytidine deaminase [Candidatus Acetothermia bacterium]
MNTNRLIQRAIQAREFAYSPYSKFPVGAALKAGEGEIYTGANVENGVNSLSICAERVALFNALSQGAREFEELAIACEGGPCRPCGSCRQTLHEHAPELKIVMADLEGECETSPLTDLLPEPFEYRKKLDQ